MNPNSNNFIQFFLYLQENLNSSANGISRKNNIIRSTNPEN